MENYGLFQKFFMSRHTLQNTNLYNLDNISVLRTKVVENLICFLNLNY